MADRSKTREANPIFEVPFAPKRGTLMDVIAVQLTLLLLAADGFRRVSEADGILLESRPVAGSRYAEYRLTMTVLGDASSMCRAAYGTGAAEKWEPHLRKRVVVREGEGERVTYEQLAPPLVSQRDYAVRRRIRLLENGACRIHFEAANAEAPPPPKGFLRIEKIYGDFHFIPLRDGRVQVVHQVFTDPGGSLPTWLVEPNRRDTAFKWMRHLAAMAHPRK